MSNCNWIPGSPSPHGRGVYLLLHDKVIVGYEFVWFLDTRWILLHCNGGFHIVTELLIFPERIHIVEEFLIIMGFIGIIDSYLMDFLSYCLGWPNYEPTITLTPVIISMSYWSILFVFLIGASKQLALLGQVMLLGCVTLLVYVMSLEQAVTKHLKMLPECRIFNG